MKSERYSTAWAMVPIESLAPELQESINLLTRTLDRNVVVKRFNDNWIAACCDLDVDLPSRGPVDGLDIRDTEPVAFLFHRSDSAQRAPEVRSDRLDFPATRLPHLNPTPSGHPPSLCLHRGSLDDWFAEHGVEDLVERVQSWYRDAARGRLMREGDFFEHTRLVAPFGAMIFSAKELDAHARARWSQDGGAPGHDLAVVKLSTMPETHMGWAGQVAVQFDWLTYGLPGLTTTELLSRWNRLASQVQDLPKMTVAVVAWSSAEPIATYFGNVPRTYAELVEFARTIVIDLHSVLKIYQDNDAHKLAAIPIVLGIRRPRPLIGRDTDIEWLNFVLVASDEDCEEDGAPKLGAGVLALSHRDPLTVAFARDLSGVEAPAPTRVIFGCGALGSKIGMHLARSGRLPRHLVDHAALNPHHLVRHGLTSGHVGKNKAVALRDEMLDLFAHGGDSVAIDAHVGSVLDALRTPAMTEGTHEYLDATASPSVLHTLSMADGLRSSAIVRRAEIADMGRLGILSTEGPERNPRLDDLQFALFDEARRNAHVADWLGRHREEIEHLRGPALEEIGLGIGCGSTTMRLRDDIVGLHAASFAYALDVTPDSSGEILLTHVGMESFAMTTSRISVPPVEVVRATGESGWHVRIARVAIERMEALLRAGRRSERGGLLVGSVHRKRRTIYVVDALPPSADSKGSPRGFTRGVGDYPQVLADIDAKTAHLIGYVGEWHTHPHGSTEPSDVDHVTVKELVASLRPARLPAHILILSQTGIRCHVEF
jgi:hypothetical protein